MNRERIKNWYKAAQKVEHKVMIKAGAYAHIVYYGLVALEAHGNYRYVAGILLVVAILHGEER